MINKYLFSLFIFIFPAAAFSQITKTAAIPYTTGTPTHTPSASGSAWAIDNSTLDLWVYYGGAWNLAGERIQTISGCAAPAYTPGTGQSLFVINGCDSLYYYRSGAWRHANKYTAPDGNGIYSGDGTIQSVTTATLQTNGAMLFNYSNDNEGIVLSDFNASARMNSRTSTSFVEVSNNKVTIGANGPVEIINGGGTSALRIREPNNGAEYTELTTGAQAANISYRLPVTNGTNGQFLQFTTGGNLQWAAAPDGSVSNEGSLTVATGGGNDSQITSNTSGSSAVTISGGSGVTVTEAGNTITIAATGGGSGTVTTSGSPTTDRLAKFTGSTVIGNSLISESGTSIGIDVTSPTAALHLKAGTATANTAPLKFTSGTINTTPEAGAMEYDGTNFYLTNGSGTRNVIGTSGGGGFTPQVNEYTTAQTNTTLAIPSGATFCEIVCIGGGSGGGSGRRGATTTARTGGGGGASGNFSITTIRVSDITSTPLRVTVGAGGAGGASITNDNTNGSSGFSGNPSRVTANNGTIICFANGANTGGGGGGVATAGTAGGTFFGGDEVGVEGVISSASGGNGQNGNTSFTKTASGGGAGAGLSTSNIAAIGGNGGSWNFGQTTQSNQGTTGTPNAGNGGAPSQGQIVGGGGGGGGGSQASAVSGNGGNGTRGGGGGGGAASSNGFASGAGGNGGTGYVRVTFW